MVPHGSPGARQVLLDRLKRKRVMSGGDRRVRGEHCRAAHVLEGIVKRLPLLDELPDALKHDETGVAFVQVKDGRRRLQRAERQHAADAEDDLLLHARLAVAAVQPGRQLAIPGRVVLEIGVEEVQLHAAKPDAPDGDAYGAIAEGDIDSAHRSVARDRGLDGRVGPGQRLVAFLLPAVRGQPLMEVALRVHETDADERHAQVAGFLAVVAGQHAQAAGVDRQRLMQGEFSREVGDGPVLDVREPSRPPRLARTARVVEAAHGGVVSCQERGAGRRVIQGGLRNRAQHPDRVVRGLAPQRVVQQAEDLTGVRVPAPPEIERELAQPVNAFGQRGQARVAIHNRPA